LREFDEVFAIGFDYGQKHVKEIEQAALIAKKAKVSYKVFDLRGVFQGSSLVDHLMDVNAAHTKNPDLPSTFTAGRNAVFLSIACAYAHENYAQNVVIGVCETDYSGYPDCRQEFVTSMQKTMRLAIENQVNIFAPLMYMSKAQTWRLANEMGILDIIIDHTLTDYNGDMTKNEWGYGKENNPATILRAKGYREAKEKGWI
jgi:7-cyano-7-deazaguanine synthase